MGYTVGAALDAALHHHRSQHQGYVEWGTITGINPGVTLSVVPPELYAQCGFNARVMKDIVTHEPRA
jgi:hypothetical protein